MFDPGDFKRYFTEELSEEQLICLELEKRAQYYRETAWTRLANSLGKEDLTDEEKASLDVFAFAAVALGSFLNLVIHLTESEEAQKKLNEGRN